MGRGAAWHLRLALAAAARQKFALAKAELAAIRPEDVSPADRAWFLYLQGQVAEAGNDVNRAKELFLKMYENPEKGRADLIAREEKATAVPPPVNLE